MEELTHFFDPHSIALVGATDKEGAAGRIILENLILASDRRKIYPVNTARDKVFSLTCYTNIGHLPEIPDLVVIITPAVTVPGIVEECGRAGARAIIIISNGFREIGGEGIARHEKLAELASSYNLKIMGPNCMGVIRPSVNLNTTFFKKIPKPGNVAFISQSGALGAGILDWAISKNIGFSAFISLGSMMGVDFADAIDYFGQDRETRSIIIYPESIGSAKKFMSAARGFARNKPIITLKPGNSLEGATAAKTHTGAMVGEDLYYGAIFRRAGVIRVEEMKDLFYCASMMNASRLPRGKNLAIVTNGGGPAVIATDILINRGGSLAKLSQDTITSLSKFLPVTWSRSNPIDIGEDADQTRFVSALEVACNDQGIDGSLVIYTPQGATDPVELAKAIVAMAGKYSKPILAAWIGGSEVAEARQLFNDNRIPAFEYPEDGIRTYLYMYQYARNLEMLYEMPDESPVGGATKNHIKAMIHRAARQGRTQLNFEESARLLSTYDIAFPAQRLASSLQEAVSAAENIGYPVAMKISSPDIIHKTEADGVILNICANGAAEEAFNAIMQKTVEIQPNAAINGVLVQKMITDSPYELIVGCRKDPVCGPVIIFGRGGLETEFFKDIAAGIPPLNLKLARRVIEQTRIYQMLLHGFRNKPPVDLRRLDDILVKVSNLITDFPEIKEIDLNPLVFSHGVAMSLDTRIVLDEEAIKKGALEYSHLVITPYPSRYIQPWRCKDGRTVLLRPIRPDDEPLEKKLLENLPEQSMRYRFFYILKEIDHEMLNRFCNIDYEREMAIIAEYSENGRGQNAGTGRLIIPADGDSGEFAVLVGSDFENKGLGLKLCDMLVGVAQEKQLKSIYGIVLNENQRMLGLAKRLGCTFEWLSPEETKVVLEL